MLYKQNANLTRKLQWQKLIFGCIYDKIQCDDGYFGDDDHFAQLTQLPRLFENAILLHGLQSRRIDSGSIEEQIVFYWEKQCEKIRTVSEKMEVSFFLKSGWNHNRFCRSVYFIDMHKSSI